MAQRRAHTLLQVALTTAAFYGVIELLAALGGAHSGAPGREARGFDPAARYLVADPERPGGWRTQMFPAESEERRIPPKGSARRVLLFGGSNTQGFPPHILEERLELATGGVDHEVINLGRRGYGSERVAILFAQALDLEPDVVVIYSGHNEFVEAGFRAELAETKPTGPLASTAEVARHMALFRWLEDGLAPDPAAAPRPEAWQGEFERFADLGYEETLARFERYGDNLGHMAESARARGIETVLATVVWNPLSPPFASKLPADVDGELRARARTLHVDGIAQLPARFRPLARDRADLRVHGTDFQRRERELPMDAVAPLARAYGGRLSERSPLWPTLERWSERAHTTLSVWGELLAGHVEEDERAAFERADELLAASLAAVPDVPLVLFHRGICALGLLDRARARQHFREAARLDRAPRKGSPLSNGIVREIAGAVAGVKLFDAEALYEARAPDGIVGFELMADECHLHVLGYGALMYDLADFLAGREPDGEGAR